jgi:hypothetical protein
MRSLFPCVTLLVLARGARHVSTMRARHASYRDSKSAVTRAYDSGWTAIAIIVAIAVAIAVSGFYWFID